MRCTRISASRFRHSSHRAEEEPRFTFDLQLFADGDKTEEPTAKKRSDAKKKGQVGRSTELSTAFVLLIGFFMLKVMSDYIMQNLTSYTTYIFSHLNQSVDTANLMALFGGILTILVKTALPIMLAIMAIGLAINFFQVGLIFNTEKLQPKLDNLNPINGVGRMFSKRSLVELVKSLLKIAIIGAFLYMFLKEELLVIPQYIYLDLVTSLHSIEKVIFSMAFQVCGVIMITIMTIASAISTSL